MPIGICVIVALAKSNPKFDLANTSHATHNHILRTQKTSEILRSDKPMSNQPSVADILAALPQEQRAIIEASLKRGAQARGFQHVGNSQYYDTKVEEGKETRTPSGIDNPNSLKISYTTKVGRRNAGLTVSRNNQNTLSIANATFAPVESLSLSRDGKLSVTLKDTFNDSEKSFITAYMKQKFVPRPAAQAAATTTTETAPSEETSPEETPATTAIPADGAIKVALIKGKLKPTAENISLVKDLMSQAGYDLAKSVQELASTT